MERIYVFAAFGSMLLTVSCLYSWFLKPWLAKLGPGLELQALLLVHAFRFISPISLIPGVTVPGLSTEFTYPQVLGDVGTALFALIAIRLLRGGSSLALPWVWFTNLFGLADLVVIGIQGTRFDFAGHVGGMFYIVAWFVPWLLLSHAMIFKRLSRGVTIRASIEERLTVSRQSA
jgi:hypothetical protein